MRLVVFGSLLVLVGCDEPTTHPASDAGPDDHDAGPDGGGADGGGPSACTEPDRECTEEHPHPGGPCDGELTCEYEDEVFFWTYRCESGEWVAEPRCGGGCPVPPLAELCLEPFDGALEGGRVAIGPPSFADPFRAFEADELVDPIWGPQGSAMIAFRIEVTGVEAPDCILATTELRIDGSAPQSSGERVRLRCGQSLGVFVIVEDHFRLCEPADPVPAEIEVEVAGIGSTTARVSLRSGGCPL